MSVTLPERLINVSRVSVVHNLAKLSQMGEGQGLKAKG